MCAMWGRVYCRKALCWLWYAIVHDSGDIVVYVFVSINVSFCVSSGLCWKG